jgi:hypothetical protein
LFPTAASAMQFAAYREAFIRGALSKCLILRKTGSIIADRDSSDGARSLWCSYGARLNARAILAW